MTFSPVTLTGRSYFGQQNVEKEVEDVLTPTMASISLSLDFVNNIPSQKTLVNPADIFLYDRMQHEALKKKQEEKQQQEGEEEEEEEQQGEEEEQEEEQEEQQEVDQQEQQSQSSSHEQYKRELREEGNKKMEEDEESSWSGLSSTSWSEEGKDEKKKRGRRRGSGSGSVHHHTHHAHHSLHGNGSAGGSAGGAGLGNGVAIAGLSRTELRDKIVSHTLKPVKTGGARKPRRGGSTNDMVDFREFPEVVDAIIDFSGLVYNYTCKDSSQLEDRVLFVGGHLNQQLLRIPRGEYAEFFLGKDTRKTSIEYIPNRLKEAVRTNNAEVLAAYTRVLDAAQRAGIPRDPSKPYISD